MAFNPCAIKEAKG